MCYHLRQSKGTAGIILEELLFKSPPLTEFELLEVLLNPELGKLFLWGEKSDGYQQQNFGRTTILLTISISTLSSNILDVNSSN
jgi:hypothetical protein